MGVVHVHVAFLPSCHFPVLFYPLHFSLQDTVYAINRVTLPVYILVSDVCSVAYFFLKEVDELPEFNSGERLEVHELLYFFNFFIDCPFVAFTQASQIVTLVQDGSYTPGRSNVHSSCSWLIIDERQFTKAISGAILGYLLHNHHLDFHVSIIFDVV